MRFEGAEYREDDFVDGMRRYVSEAHPIYAMDDAHGSALHEFLFAASPDPEGLLALFAANRKREVDDAVLKRDVVASIVATSFERRIVERPSDPHRAALYDALALAFANFAFDPSYEDAHTRTSLEVGDFFADGRFPPCAESRAAFERHLPGMLEAWRDRVTRKGTSSFFGIVLRHLGAAGGEALVREWPGMDAEERKDLLLRLKDEEDLLVGARLGLVAALLDPSLEVREAALAALRKQGAPVPLLDPSTPDEGMAAASGPLRDWARKTRS